MKRFCLVLSWLLACSLAQGQIEETEVTPESVGMSSETLRATISAIREEDLDVRSLLVLRHGQLVLEWYSGGVTRDHAHNCYSMTKSVVSILAGLAIQHGDLPGTEVTLGEAFARHELGAGMESITLEDLLTMRSGFPVSRANSPTGPERQLFDRIQKSEDRLTLLLEGLPLASKPGGTFTYGNIDPQLVSAMIEADSGQSVDNQAERHLFAPLGFENHDWRFDDEEGLLPGGFGLYLRAIDLAKLGQLMLQGGVWEGRPFLDSAWVKASTEDQTGTGYGYYWWLEGSGSGFSAKGVKGQRLEVYPESGLVFVMTAELPAQQVSRLTNRFSREIRAAIQSDDALPPSPLEVQELRDELNAARDWEPTGRSGLPAFRLPLSP